MNEWRMSRIARMNGVKGEGGMTEYNDEWMKNENEPDSWDEWGSPEIVISDKENSTALPPLALSNIV